MPTDYAGFWSQKEVISINLSFSTASLYALSHFGYIDDQKWGDVYFPADFSLTIGGTTTYAYEVGVRMKGNTSRAEFLNFDGTFKPDVYAHFKVTFKATFDDPIYDYSQFLAFKHDWSDDAAGRKVRKNRTFYGMEKFDLKYLPRNTYEGKGATYSQEMYCYQRFNDAGILAPHTSWASLNLSSSSASRTSDYELVEDIDKAFLKNRLGKDEAQGDLYKCVYSSSKADFTRSGAVTEEYDSVTGYCSGTRIANGRIGVEDNFNYYHPSYQLKTNDEGEGSNFSKMANLINAAHSCRYEKGPIDLLSSVLDIDEFLKFEAISFLFGNYDDQRMNWNNFFLYFRPSDGKAIYLPYDWDWSLGNSLDFDMVNLDPFYSKGLDGKSEVANPYWDTIIPGGKNSDYSLDSYRATYLQDMKDALQNGYLDPSAYETFIAPMPNKSDLPSVTTYMNAKSAFITSYLKH